MRLRAAVCDDQPEVLGSMKKLLLDTELVHSVTCYNNIRELRDELKEGKEVDILILDIGYEFDGNVAEDDIGKNGIDFACELKQDYPFLQIVYMAEHDERYAQTIFFSPVQPAGFLFKPVNAEYIYKLLLLAIERLKNESGERLVVSGKSRHIFTLSEVLYLESKAHITKIHTVSGVVYECRDKLSDLEKQVHDKFVRCHQSYLVNLQHVDYLGKDNTEKSETKRDILILDSQEIIVISKKRYADTKQRIRKYLGNAE